MIAVKLIAYILLSFGVTECMVYFDGPFNVFHHMRKLFAAISDNLAALISCMFCTSTWIGLFLSLINIIFVPTIPFTPFNMVFNDISLWWLIIPFDMFATSGSVWLLYTLESMMERVGMFGNTEEEEEQ